MDLRIECLEKKYQPSSLSGVRFGSRAIQFMVKIMERSTSVWSKVTLVWSKVSSIME